MRALLFLVFLSGCAAVPLRTASTPATLELKSIEGTWHVVATNFPLWTKGDKTNPSFVYGVIDDRHLSDAVRYLADGQPDSIEGVDTQHETTPTHFTWRGRGILALFTSDWDVVALDPAGAWAIIYFSSTLATPEGVDVITREATPAPGLIDAALTLIAADPVLSLKAVGLKKLVAP